MAVVREWEGICTTARLHPNVFWSAQRCIRVMSAGLASSGRAASKRSSAFAIAVHVLTSAAKT